MPKNLCARGICVPRSLHNCCTQHTHGRRGRATLELKNRSPPLIFPPSGDAFFLTGGPPWEALSFWYTLFSLE